MLQFYNLCPWATNTPLMTVQTGCSALLVTLPLAKTTQHVLGSPFSSLGLWVFGRGAMVGIMTDFDVMLSNTLVCCVESPSSGLVGLWERGHHWYYDGF